MPPHPDLAASSRHGSASIRWIAALALAVVAGALVAPTPASAATEDHVTAIVSAKADWTSSGGQSQDARLASDGRFVAFTSTSFTLVSGVTTTFRHVYLHDLWTDEKWLVSHDQDGVENKVEARASAITKTGSHVAFVTKAKLDPADTNSNWDVYVWTRATDEVELVSKGASGAIGNGDSGLVNSTPMVAISDDGRYVAFSSEATNLTFATDSNTSADVFRRDRQSAVTSWISLNGAQQLNGDSTEPDMSANGRYLTFTTAATNLPGTDTNGGTDVWLRDTNNISPEKVSIGLDADANGGSRRSKVSDDGNLVVFQSAASDLVSSDTNSTVDIFQRNRTGGTTTRLSVHDTTGAQLDSASTDPDMSPTGSRVAFTSAAAATSASTAGTRSIFVRSGSTTSLASVTTAGGLLTDDSENPSIDSSGDVAWTSDGKFAATDTNSLYDVFVRQSLFLGPFTNVDTFVTTQYQRFRGVAPTAAAVTAEAKLIRSGASPLHLIVTLSDEAAFSA